MARQTRVFDLARAMRGYSQQLGIGADEYQRRLVWELKRRREERERAAEEQLLETGKLREYLRRRCEEGAMRVIDRIGYLQPKFPDAFREALLAAYRSEFLMTSGLSPARLVELFRIAEFPVPALLPPRLYRGYSRRPITTLNELAKRRNWLTPSGEPLHPAWGMSWTANLNWAHRNATWLTGNGERPFVVAITPPREAIVAYLPDWVSQDYILDPELLPQPEVIWKGVEEGEFQKEWEAAETSGCGNCLSSESRRNEWERTAQAVFEKEQALMAATASGFDI